MSNITGISITTDPVTDKNIIVIKFSEDKFALSLADDDTLNFKMMIESHLKDKGVDWCETSI